MSRFYILEGKNIKPVGDVIEWGRWFEQANRHVASTDLHGNVQVSTVFLGLDHSFGEGGNPILFETMIFGGRYDQYQKRYETWEEAEAGHLQAVELAKSRKVSNEN